MSFLSPNMQLRKEKLGIRAGTFQPLKAHTPRPDANPNGQLHVLSLPPPGKGTNHLRELRWAVHTPLTMWLILTTPSPKPRAPLYRCEKRPSGSAGNQSSVATTDVLSWAPALEPPDRRPCSWAHGQVRGQQDQRSGREAQARLQHGLNVL